jgi:hypothetical protein
LWENFLRIDVGKPSKPSKPSIFGSGGGLHASSLYGFTYWPQLQFLTWVLYVLYLSSFLNVGRDPEVRRPVLAFAGFFLVHASLAVFAWGSHFAPETFEFQAIPFCKLDCCWWPGGWTALFYLLPLIPLVILNVWYFRWLSAKAKEHSEN